MSFNLLDYSQSTLPEHCTPTSAYLVKLSSAFRSCVPTSLALLSTSLGILSIVAWLFAQLPQIYKNYKLKSASGLSIFFLGEWLLGDLTNLLGASFTGQAQWQVGIAMYYVIVDVCLTSQYLWYTHINRWRTRRLWFYNVNGQEGHDSPPEVLMAIDPVDDGIHVDARHPCRNKSEPKGQELHGSGNQPHLSAATLITAEKCTEIPPQRTFFPPLHLNATGVPSKALFVSLLCVTAAASPLQDPRTHWHPHLTLLQRFSEVEFLGRIFSWMSTLLYLGSRLPQIYKNAIRRSTSGLSPYMFLAAFCGNLFYSTAMIANPLAWASYPPYGAHGWAGPEGSDRPVWLRLAAPFWLGAAGVLILDASVGLQFLMYGDGNEVEVLVEDRKGRSRWTRVTGWMRGWIPSPSPCRRIDVADEEQRPLVARRASRSSRYGSA